MNEVTYLENGDITAVGPDGNTYTITKEAIDSLRDIHGLDPVKEFLELVHKVPT